jgi:hypothetical protein
MASELPVLPDVPLLPLVADVPLVPLVPDVLSGGMGELHAASAAAKVPPSRICCQCCFMIASFSR